MRCPFLKETRVKFCQAAAVKKMIEQTTDGADDLCTSSAFYECADFRKQRKSSSAPACPFLQESNAQLCSHDPSVRFVPCSDHFFSRCGTENYRYCEIYLAATHRTPAILETRRDFRVGMPDALFFARNHMWLDISQEHTCHVGLDALLMRVLGRVEKLSFITNEGERCPSVVLTAHGMNLHMIFPNPMHVTCSNTHVRTDPEKIRIDPYGAGWLFEGTEVSGNDIRSGLLSGGAARLWMEREVGRIAALVHSRTSALAADGGFPVEGAIRYLRRREIPQFFDELFKREEAV